MSHKVFENRLKCKNPTYMLSDEEIEELVGQKVAWNGFLKFLKAYGYIIKAETVEFLPDALGSEKKPKHSVLNGHSRPLLSSNIE